MGKHAAGDAEAQRGAHLGVMNAGRSGFGAELRREASANGGETMLGRRFHTKW